MDAATAWTGHACASPDIQAGTAVKVSTAVNGCLPSIGAAYTF